MKTILIKKNGAIIIYDQRLSDEDCKKALKGNLMGNKLSDDTKNKLAEADGFYGVQCKSGELMLHWWKQTHDLPFIGDIIYWKKETFKPATGSGK